MIPPPAMTTSAVSMAFGQVAEGSAGGERHAPHLEDELERGEDRDVPVVEWRRNLDHVQSDYLRTIRRGMQKVERFSGRQTARRGNLRPGRESRIERVDVERDVDLAAAKSVRNLLG